MKLKAVLSFLLCIALFAGMFVLPAGAAVSAVTITFFTEGGTPVMPITQDEGTAVTPPPDPTKEDYFFIGWEPPLPAIMPANDMLCIAQWEENPGIGPSMIYFDSNGGTPVDPIVVGPEGMMICPPEPPTREGYAFMGWEPPIPAIMLEYNMTCVAQWEPYTFTITFDSDGGSAVAPITQDVGTEVIPPADPTREGYIFMGWMPELPATMPVYDLTCVAQWDIPPDPSVCGTIHLDPGGGRWYPDPYGIDPIIINDEGGIPYLPTLTKEGYIFIGWEPPIPAYCPVDDITCVAQWEPMEYTVTFDSMGGSEVDSITQDCGTAITEWYAPTRTGYTFVGWEPPVPENMPADDITCVAQWVVNQYTLTFDSMGGSDVDSITQDYGTAVTAPADPTREGYAFMGWLPPVPVIMPVDDVTCVAQWEEIPFPTPWIYFDSRGGTPVEPISCDGGTITKYPPDPTKEGFIFRGWEPSIPASCPVDDITCVAQWEPIVVPQSTITFDSDGGSPVASITQDEGTEVTPPADPVKPGYDFMGWMPAVPATMPADDVTCVALWKISTCTPEIIFNSDGGSYIPTITGNYGEPILPPATPTKRGYTFGGWSPALPATLPACGITLTAIWILNKYNAYFIVDESVYATIPTDYGAQIATPAPPVKAGYTFLGWAPTVGVMSDADKTFTALFIINTYNAIFMVDGQLYQAIPTLYGAQITPPADPVKAGYIFTGWSPAIPAIMPEDDITCVAQWRLLGDLDNNGSITSVDALIALQGSTGEHVLSALQLLLADANHDGRISSMDALMLLRAASGLITI